MKIEDCHTETSSAQVSERYTRDPLNSYSFLRDGIILKDEDSHSEEPIATILSYLVIVRRLRRSNLMAGRWEVRDGKRDRRSFADLYYRGMKDSFP